MFKNIISLLLFVIVCYSCERNYHYEDRQLQAVVVDKQYIDSGYTNIGMSGKDEVVSDRYTRTSIGDTILVKYSIKIYHKTNE